MSLIGQLTITPGTADSLSYGYSDSVPFGSIVSNTTPWTFHSAIITNDSGGPDVVDVSANSSDSPWTTPPPDHIDVFVDGVLLMTLTNSMYGFNMPTFDIGTPFLPSVPNIVEPAEIRFDFYDEPTVPDVVGLTVSAATTALTAVGLVLGTETDVSDAAPAGNIIAQSPAAGGYASTGSAVDITVSTGPPPVTVPNIVGESVADATADLTFVGLVLGTETDVDDTAPYGTVIAQSPTAGSSVASGSSVDITVSQGLAPTTVFGAFVPPSVGTPIALSDLDGAIPRIYPVADYTTVKVKP